MQIRFYILIFFLFNALLLHAQIPSFTHYEVGNGLPSNELYYLKQDRKGFLWIGTDAGLARFNGHSFKLYTNKQQKGASVTSIQEDSKGNIWCHNFSGQVFTIKSDSLTIYSPWNKFYNNQLIEIAIDKNDYLYVSNFRNYIYKFNTNNNSYSTISSNTSVKQSIFTTNTNQLLYSDLSTRTVNAITNLSIQKVPFKALNNLTVQDSVYNAFVFFNSTKGKQTMGFQRQHQQDKFPTLYSFVNNILTVHPISAYLRKNNIYPVSVLNDDDGNCMIGTFKGCYWFKEINGVWQFKKLLFPNKAISNILKDREGSYWFATLKNGLYQIPNLQVSIFEQKDIKLPDNIVGALTINTKNKLYVAGSGKEISVIDVTTNTLKQQYFTNEARDVQGFFYDTLFDRLLYYKNNFSIITKLGIENYPNLLSAAKDFYVRKDGVIFSAGVTLVAAYNNTVDKTILSNEFKEAEGLRLNGENEKSGKFEFFNLSNQRSRAVWYDEINKILWSADADGTVYFKNKKKYTLYDSASKQQVIATCFFQLKNGTLCIGTIENGVYFLNSASIIKHLTTKEGLQSNRIKKIKAIDSILIIATNVGVQKIDLNTNKFNNLTINNGLVSSEIFDIATTYQQLYISTSKGLQVLPINIETKNLVAPSLSINKIVTEDATYTKQLTISLKKNKSSIAIWLDGTALKSKGSFKYQYRLIGLNTNFTSVDAANNIVRYPSLPAGKYTFEAVCINEDGVSSKAEKINFTILNPWYQQWWFIILVFITALFIVFYITRKNLNRKKTKVEEALQQSKVQEELRQSQLASLKAQMNPHFMFNALNSIQEFILLNNKRQANMYMGKFADLMRLTLDHSNKETITLEDEIKILHLYLELEALRFEENFEYQIEQTSIENLLGIEIPAMLVQPYVENAIKHGLLHKQGLKKLYIKFSVNNNILICTVIDNGIGRKRSGEINDMRHKKYTSFATGATQKRLELLNYNKPKFISVQYKDVYTEIGTANGTEVQIHIPF